MVFPVVSLLSSTCTGCPPPDSAWHFWQMQPKTHLVFFLLIHTLGLICTSVHKKNHLEMTGLQRLLNPNRTIIIWWEKWMLYVSVHGVTTYREPGNFHSWLIFILVACYESWTYKLLPIHTKTYKHAKYFFNGSFPDILMCDSLEYTNKVFRTPPSLFDTTWCGLLFTCLCMCLFFLGVVSPMKFDGVKVYPTKKFSPPKFFSLSLVLYKAMGSGFCAKLVMRLRHC